jgi:hypothetical protein
LQGPQAKFSLGAKGPSSQFGMQAEGGIYLWNAGVPTGQITGSKEGSPTDWHIRNGQVEEGREGFNKQFADIEQDTGIKLRSQSVLPQAGDNTAPVHMKVPNVNLNFGNSEEGRVRGTASGGQQSTLAGTNEFQTQERQPNMIDNVRGFFGMEDKAQRVISPEAMSATLTELAKQNPEHPELQYVSPEALREANKDRLVDFTDPTTGERSKGFKVGDWVDTTLAVSTGGPGLHVRPDNLPEGSVGEDGKLKDGIAMPHWDAHKDPRGVPAHAGTPDRAP